MIANYPANVTEPLLAYEQTQGRQGGAVNMNDGLHSALRGKLNRLMRRTKGCSKTDGMLTMSLAMVWLKLGWI